MDVEIWTCDPDVVTHDAIRAALEGVNFFVGSVTINVPEDDEDSHPEHAECADGCGLAVTHVGACLDKPGGRVVCEHDDEEGEE